MSSKATAKSWEKLSALLTKTLSSAKMKDPEVKKVLATIAEHKSEFLVVSSSSKKKRDPNAPKKPLTGYIIYCQKEREALKAKHPEMSAKDLTRQLGANWNALSDKQKKKYNDQSAEDKKRYEAQMADYTPPEDSETPASKKRARKEKNGGVKGVLSAYMFFCKDQREKVKKDCPDLTTKDITKELGIRWKALTDKQKVPYNKQHEQDRERHARELEAAGVPVPERKTKGKPKSEEKVSSKKVSAKAEKPEKEEKTKAPVKGSSESPGFLYYVQEHKGDLQDKNKSWGETRVMTELKKMWKALPEEERREYDLEADVKEDDDDDDEEEHDEEEVDDDDDE